MNLQKIGATVVVILFVVLGANNLVSNQNQLHIQKLQVKSKNAELKTLELKYDNLQIELNKTDKNNQEQIKKLQEEKDRLEQERLRLEKELAVKRASKLQIASQSIPTSGSASASSNCGTDPYMSQIYMRESGCRVGAVNPIGCTGLGQSCPASKIAHCGLDWACQNAWFTNYANVRYGSPAQAWAFWQKNHWW